MTQNAMRPVLLMAVVALNACSDLSAPTHEAAYLRGDALSSSSLQATSYTVQDLPPLLGANRAFGFGINSSGDVAGYSETNNSQDDHAVVWHGTAPTDLGLPPGAHAAVAHDVNDRGTSVGNAYLTGATVGVLWPTVGAPITFSSPSNAYINVVAVNNQDVAVGRYTWVSASQVATHAFRYSQAGGFVDLHPAGYLASTADAISDAGVIAGSVTLASASVHAAMWSASGSVVDLGTLGGTFAEALGINASNAIVGDSQDGAGTFRPFLWRATTGMVGGGFAGVATDISDRGRIAGVPSASNRAGTQKGQVAALLPLPSGSLSSFSRGINLCGTVAGYYVTSSGQAHSARWVIAVCD